MFIVNPIGYFHSSTKAPYDLPRQAGLIPRNEGVIQLIKGAQFEQALEGLEGFDRLWVVFQFHRCKHWKPKVLPPRGGKKQGVFATRSPHRPNFIGFSCVQLQEIKGLSLFIIGHDLIDGTPILDLKPYLNYADSFSSARQGWLEALPLPQKIVFQWSSLAQVQTAYLADVWSCHLRDPVEHRLSQSLLPYPNHRVKDVGKGEYELSYRTWRICYSLQNEFVKISHLKSGYDSETLLEKKSSKWDDVHIHQAFEALFR